MPWPPHIEQWRKFAIWEGRDIPADLILSIINHESGGVAGRLSEQTTRRTAEIEKTDGSKIVVNRAMGLMQIIPPNVAAWNERNEKAFFEDMTGSNERGARLQIRLGAWTFASNVRLLNQFDPVVFHGVTPGAAPAEQLRLALVSYAIGFGNLKPKLEKLKAQGKEMSLKNLQISFPAWGFSEKTETWINRPLHYARVVWEALKKHADAGLPGLAIPFNPLSLPDVSSVTAAAGKLKNDWLWILIAAVLALLFAGKKSSFIEAGKARIVGRK